MRRIFKSISALYEQSLLIINVLLGVCVLPELKDTCILLYHWSIFIAFLFVLFCFCFFLKVEIVLMFVGGLRTKKEDYHKLSNWEPRAKLHDVMHPMRYSFGYIMLSGFLFQQNKNNAK